jgi:hypothetical protein
MELTASNTLVLPQKLAQAPTCWHREELWFDKEPHDWDFDFNCEQALIAVGIGKRECPTIAGWAAFVIAGALVATLTEKYIVPPDPEPLGWSGKIEHFIWEALWKAAQENSNALDKRFIATMLRSFLPREHRAPPNRPYRESNFVRSWGPAGLQYPDTIMHSVGNLRLRHLQNGLKAFDSLPEEMQDSIRQVAQHVPTMLEIAIQRIRKTYMW